MAGVEENAIWWYKLVRFAPPACPAPAGPRLSASRWRAGHNWNAGIMGFACREPQGRASQMGQWLTCREPQGRAIGKIAVDMEAKRT